MLNLTYSPNVCAYTFDRATKTLTLTAGESITTPTIAYRAATLHLVVADLLTPLPVDEHTNWGEIFSKYINIRSVNGTDAPWLPYYKRSWKMITVQPSWTNYDNVPDYIKNDVVRVWIPAGNEATVMYISLKTEMPKVSEAYYYGTDFDNYFTLRSGIVNLYAPNIPKTVNANTLRCNASDLSNIANIRGVATATDIVIYGQLSEDQLRNLKNLREANGPMSSLTNITLPEQTGTLPDHCFYQCGWLESFSAQNISVLATDCLARCNALVSLYLPNVTELVQGAFYYCSSLETVTLVKAQRINVYSLGGCISLRYLTFGSEIIYWDGNDVFYGGTSASSITLHLLNANEYSRASGTGGTGGGKNIWTPQGKPPITFKDVLPY